MAINVTAYDIQNYPDNPKTLTIDLKSVIPTGGFGDEKYTLSCDTSATASGSAVIQEAFVSDCKVGWAMSSSRVTGTYLITESNKNFKVAIDESIDSAITVTVSTDSVSQTGASIAADIEYKIQGSTVVGGAKAGNLSYRNARCEYVDGRFFIVSGSSSANFIGTRRSPVVVAAGATVDASVTLGFDVPIQSVDLASQNVIETYVASNVVSDTTVPVASTTGIVAGDCIAFKIAAGTIYYRYVDSVSAPNLIVNTAITVDQNTMVQLLKIQDPRSNPASYYGDIDSYMRFAIEKIVRQINFAA
jgi:hypothetical protein